MSEPKQRTYMREYMRNKYITDGAEMRAKNRAYYYKAKCGLSDEDLKTYGTHLPFIAKIRKSLDELIEADANKAKIFLDELTSKKATIA